MSGADEVWTMRDGTKIKVGDMSETHVRNTLRLILRRWRLGEFRTTEQLFVDEPDWPHDNWDHD